MKLLQNKEIIGNLLKSDPSLRDDDFRLISNVLAYVIRKKYGEGGFDKCKPFLKMYSEGRLPNFETIRRTRQKLQEENPQLRGKRYKERTGRLEKEARLEIRKY